MLKINLSRLFWEIRINKYLYVCAYLGTYLYLHVNNSLLPFIKSVTPLWKEDNYCVFIIMNNLYSTYK